MMFNNVSQCIHEGACTNIINRSVSTVDVRPASDAFGASAKRIGAERGIIACSAENLQSTETRR